MLLTCSRTDWASEATLEASTTLESCSIRVSWLTPIASRCFTPWSHRDWNLAEESGRASTNWAIATPMATNRLRMNTTIRVIVAVAARSLGTWWRTIQVCRGRTVMTRVRAKNAGPTIDLAK